MSLSLAYPRVTTVGDFFALLKPRVMSLVVFTGLAGIVVVAGTSTVERTRRKVRSPLDDLEVVDEVLNAIVPVLANTALERPAEGGLSERVQVQAAVGLRVIRAVHVAGEVDGHRELRRNTEIAVVDLEHRRDPGRRQPCLVEQVDRHGVRGGRRRVRHGTGA